MGFPEQLKAARLNRNYTQQQVADWMGITKSTYCGYETGKREPDIEKIRRLAEILHTSGDTLLETDVSLENDENVLLSVFRTLKPEFREYALEQLKGLKALQDRR